MSERARTWLITGCGGGIGRALAGCAAAAGMNVVATARDEAALQDLASSERVHIARLDVTAADDIGRVVAEASDRFGAVDVLVNNATGRLHGAIEEVDADDYRALFEANVFGALELMRAVLPQMRARRMGTIVNFSSLGGLTAQAGLGHYSATKFAIEALSEALALECGPLGIRVVLAVPTSVRTPWAGATAAGSRRCISDYEATSGRTRRLLAERAGRQLGDPAKAARAVVDAVLSDDPPFRLFLGAYGIERVRDKLARVEADMASWRAIALGELMGAESQRAECRRLQA